MVLSKKSINWDHLFALQFNGAYNSFVNSIKEILEFFAQLHDIVLIVIPGKCVIRDRWITPGIPKSSFTLGRSNHCATRGRFHSMGGSFRPR